MLRKKELKEIERQGAVKRKWDSGTLKVDSGVDGQVRKRIVRDLRDSWAAAPRLHRAVWFDVMDAGIRLHWHPACLGIFRSHHVREKSGGSCEVRSLGVGG